MDLMTGAAALVNPVALAGNALQFGGQYMTNQANAKMASDMADRNQFNSAAQMEFQRTMSNTAHTREVADLKAAGLNPILSAMSSGASTPSGSSSSGSASTSSNPMEGISSNIMAALKTKADIGLTEAMTRKANVESTVASKGIPKADIINKVYKGLTNAGGSAVDAVRKVYTDVSRTAADRKRSGKNTEVDSMRGRFNMLRRGFGNFIGGSK